MSDSLREMIRRVRRSGMSTDDAHGDPSRNALERQAAEAVRLARVATAMHMSQVDTEQPITCSVQNRLDVAEPVRATRLQWAEAGS